MGIRLPRAGTDTPYPWRGDLTEAEACFEKDEMRATGIGTPNAWGLRDMVGNIGQWCADADTTYPSQAVSDPHPANDGSKGIGRGGSWEDNAGDCRSARRMHPWITDPGLVDGAAHAGGGVASARKRATRGRPPRPSLEAHADAPPRG